MIELTKEEAEAIVNYGHSSIHNEDVMAHLLQIDDYGCCLLPCFGDGDKVNAWAKIPKYVEE